MVDMIFPFPFTLRRVNPVLGTADSVQLFFLKHTPLLEKLILNSHLRFGVRLKREILELLRDGDVIFPLS